MLGSQMGCFLIQLPPTFDLSREWNVLLIGMHPGPIFATDARKTTKFDIAEWRLIASILALLF